jgi:hypothetical protein
MLYAALATLVVGLIYFVISVEGVGLLLSPVAGLVGFLYWRLIDPDERGPKGYARVLSTTAIGGALGILPGLVLGLSRTPGWDAAGVLLAVVMAAAFFSMRAQGKATPCVLCRMPAPQRAGFDCPRCNDRVCARPTCWNARYSRCKRCHEREIVIFPIAENWWTKRLGRRVLKGECLSCYKEALETDLRECGQCHWPMCKRCWDYHNGMCRRCDWVIPDLPPRLAPFMRVKAARGGDRSVKRPGAPAGGAGARPGGPPRAVSQGAPPAERQERPARPRRR